MSMVCVSMWLLLLLMGARVVSTTSMYSNLTEDTLLLIVWVICVHV